MWFPEMMVPQVTMDPKYENGLIQYQNGLILVFCFASLYFRKPHISSSGPQVTVLPKSRCLGQMLLHLRSYFWRADPPLQGDSHNLALGLANH